MDAPVSGLLRSGCFYSRNKTVDILVRQQYILNDSPAMRRRSIRGRPTGGLSFFIPSFLWSNYRARRAVWKFLCGTGPYSRRFSVASDSYVLPAPRDIPRGTIAECLSRRPAGSAIRRYGDRSARFLLSTGPIVCVRNVASQGGGLPQRVRVASGARKKPSVRKFPFGVCSSLSCFGSAILPARPPS